MMTRNLSGGEVLWCRMYDILLKSLCTFESDFNRMSWVSFVIPLQMT